MEWSKLYNAVQDECRQRLLMAESEMATLRSTLAKSEREKESLERELGGTKQRVERAESAVAQVRV